VFAVLPLVLGRFPIYQDAACSDVLQRIVHQDTGLSQPGSGLTSVYLFHGMYWVCSRSSRRAERNPGDRRSQTRNWVGLAFEHILLESTGAFC